MPLPTPVKNWQYQVNQTVLTTGVSSSDFQTLWLKILNLLLGFTTNPWTMVQCSDGAGTVSSSNILTTIAKFVWATQGTNHTWFVLKQTGVGSNFEVCFDLAASSRNNAVISFSPNAGFTGGTATAAPTATDEVFLVGTAHNAPAAYTGTGLSSSAVTQFEVHALQSTDGQCTRLVMETYSSGGYAGFFALFDKPNNPVTGTPGWANPCVGIWSVVSMTPANFNTSSSNGCKGRANGVVMPLFLTSLGIQTGLPITRQTVQSDVSGEFPITAIGLFSATTSAKGRHGSLYDLWWVDVSVNNGDAFYSKGTSLRAVGQILIPWNRSTPLTA